MFELPDQKLFRDVIHGYIKIPRCFVENIVDTAIFQRLRNIDQTGMRVLYPDAKHDRFGHSLGVFHLGCQAVDALLENFRSSESKYWYVRSDDSLNAFWAKNKVLFLIACLLHDIGHAPFSHAMENELHMTAGAEEFDTKLAELLGIEYDELAKQKAASHEKIGAYLIIKHMNEPIKRIVEYLNYWNYPRRHQSALLVEPTTSKSFVNTDEITDDIRFIARMVLGLKYRTEFNKNCFEPEKQIRNCFIDLLNGNNFDVDTLDYIMRDTQVSGIKNTSIDVERLLGAISIVTLTNYCEVVAVPFGERTLIQTIKSEKSNDDVRIYPPQQVKISGYVDGTLIIKANAVVIIENDIEIAEIRKYGNEESRITLLDRVNFVAQSNENSHVNFGGRECLMNNDAVGFFAQESPGFVTGASCYIKNSKTSGNFKFKFKVEKGAFALTFKGICKVSILGDFENDSPLVFNKNGDDGNIEGKSIQLVVVNDRIIDEIPTYSKYNTFSVGFKKSAVGNISAVLDARDNLYKWIYAHHKVMYYANFLIPVVTMGLLQDKLLAQMKTDNLGKNILTIDDAFVWTHVKEQYQKNSETVSADISKLVSELVERKYKNSLFKSLPEYDVIFETFTVEKKKKMYQKFRENVNSTNNVSCTKYIKKGAVIPEQEITAGFINIEFINKIYNNACKEKNHRIKKLVWLAAQYKHKDLDIKTTYLIYKNDTPTTLSRIDLLSNTLSLPNNDTSQYFYLYFDVEDIEDETAKEKKKRESNVREKISDALVKYDWNECPST